MRNIRVFYKKVDRLKYLSHLDLMRSMMRALKMSGLEVKYTQGYNPRIYLTFALPLSLGYEGERESMDFDLLDDTITLEEVKNRLVEVLPKSLPVIEVALVQKEAGSIAYGDYKIIYSPVEDFNESIEEHKELWEQLFLKKEMVVEKRSKKKINTIDIKPDIMEVKIESQEENIVISLRVPAGINKNINPRLILSSFNKEYKKKINPNIIRTVLLDENQELFR